MAPVAKVKGTSAPPAARGYKPPPEIIASKDNKYYAQPFVPVRVVSNCDHSLGKNRDPVTYADSKRGPRHFCKPLIDPEEKLWPSNEHLMRHIITKDESKSNAYYEPVLSDDILDKHLTFEEWKNSRTYEDFNPGLFKAPHKVYPGRLFGTAFGSFDWWRSEPEFDWYNVSNNQRGNWFRNDPTNSMGDSVGPRIKPSREICRVPPTHNYPQYNREPSYNPNINTINVNSSRSKSEDLRERKNCTKIPIYATPPVKKGYVPLVRKYVPPVPRFPLEFHKDPGHKNGGHLLPTWGGFKPLDTMRGQVDSGRYYPYTDPNYYNPHVDPENYRRQTAASSIGTPSTSRSQITSSLGSSSSGGSSRGRHSSSSGRRSVVGSGSRGSSCKL